jgi:ParB/RepB/Spo0J family partition protein
MSTPTTVQKAIPWKQIRIPEGRNVRSDLPDIEELAANMVEHGQISPITVRNGRDGDQPYELVAGARRMAAFAFNGWQDGDVMCVVREYSEGDFLGPIADNWIENSQRVNVSFMDQANWIHRLVKGNYPVAEGEEAKPVDKKDICERFNISSTYLNSMLRSVEKIDESAAKKAMRADVPNSLVIAMARVEGEGETPEDKQGDRAAKQEKLVDEYVAKKKELEAAGRKRAPRTEKKKTSRLRDEEPEDTGILRLAKKLDEKGRTVRDYMVVLEAKEGAVKGAGEKSYYEGMRDAFRWLTGEVKRCPMLKEADFDVLIEEEEEEEEEETDE